MNDIRLIATDLDGTLLRLDKTVSQTDISTLHKLGEMKVIRVAATGRSMYSVRKVISSDFPFDYIVFSTGAGIYDWKNDKLIYSTCLNHHQTKLAARIFIDEGFDFAMHYPIPDNHRFVYYKNNELNQDFERYIEYYKDFCTRWNGNLLQIETATQLLAILKLDELRYKIICQKLPDFKVIRTTSPVNPDFMWIEVFHPNVSKGHTLEKLCQILDIKPHQTISVGNDFNDLDMLHFTAYSFVVDNAHNDLKQMFRSSASHQENGFTVAVGQIIH